MTRQSSEEYKNGMIHALVRMTFPEKYHQSLVTLIPLVGVFSLGVKASQVTCPKQVQFILIKCKYNYR